MIPSNASVGDEFPVRVPGHFPGGCTQFTDVTAQVRVITPRGFWLVDLRYAARGDVPLPSRVVLKTVLVRPGAPSSMYRNEVRFYRDIRPELAI